MKSKRFLKKAKSKRISRKRSTQRNKTKRGGEINTQGYNSKIYLNPRLLCENESEVTEEMYNQVSKASLESEIPNRTKLFLDQGLELERLQNYFVIPIKSCKINSECLNGNEPYTAKYFQTGFFNNSESNKKYLGDIIDNDLQMVVYPKLQKTLFDCLSEARNLDSILEFLLKLRNVFDGLLYLEQHGLVYLDLHSKNIMITYDGIMKTIDIESIYRGPSLRQFQDFLTILYENIYTKFMAAGSKFPYDRRLVFFKNLIISNEVFSIRDNMQLSLHNEFYKQDKKVVEKIVDYISIGFFNIDRILSGDIRDYGEESKEEKAYKRSLNNMNEETISRKYFFGENFQGQNINNKNFTNVSFHSCNLDNVDFRGCSFSHTDFSHASLRNTSFIGAKIEFNVTFYAADVYKCKFVFDNNYYGNALRKHLDNHAKHFTEGRTKRTW